MEVAVLLADDAGEAKDRGFFRGNRFAAAYVLRLIRNHVDEKRLGRRDFDKGLNRIEEAVEPSVEERLRTGLIR